MFPTSTRARIQEVIFDKNLRLFLKCLSKNLQWCFGSFYNLTSSTGKFGTSYCPSILNTRFSHLCPRMLPWQRVSAGEGVWEREETMLVSQFCGASQLSVFLALRLLNHHHSHSALGVVCPGTGSIRRAGILFNNHATGFIGGPTMT